MGLFKRTQHHNQQHHATSSSNDERKRKKSIFDLVIPKTRVSEATLQVWRQLPDTIRKDPSMANFQREAERWKGNECIFFMLHLEK